MASPAGFRSPLLFSSTLSPPSAMPADPCPESILFKAAGQAYLLEGRAMVIMDEAFSPLVV